MTDPYRVAFVLDEGRKIQTVIVPSALDEEQAKRIALNLILNRYGKRRIRIISAELV